MKSYKFRINGNEYKVDISSVTGNTASVYVNGIEYQVELDNTESPSPALSAGKAESPVRESVHSPSADPGSTTGRSVVSPLPGVIIGLKVKVGDTVSAGQEVAVLEAMKMENSIEAVSSGTVTAIHVSEGDSVLEGDPIVSIA